MSGLACCVWWFVAGILLGWLLNWLLSRLLRKDPPNHTDYRSGDRSGRSTYSAVGAENTGTASTGTVDPASTRGHDARSPDGYRSDFTASSAPASSGQGVAPAAFTAAPVAIDLVAARDFGFDLRHADDLVIVEGIGPKIDELFRAAGITNFAELANTSVERMRQILDDAGPRYRIANPATWAEQASLAAQNRWAELKALQDRLDAGVARSNDL